MLKVELERFKNSIKDRSKEDLISIAVEYYEKYGDITACAKETERSLHEMFLQFTDVKTHLDSLKKENKILKEQVEHLAGVRFTQAQEMYGKSSEKSSGLFNDFNQHGSYEDPLSEDANESSESEEIHGSNVIKLPVKHKGDKSGKQRSSREEWMSKLPWQKIYDYDIDELNRTYGEGGWVFYFWEAHDFVEYQRAYSYRKTVYTPIIRPTGTRDLCRCPFEGRIIDKSFVSSSLLAQILNDFCAMGLPTYRMEHDADRFGFHLSRQTMTNWIRYAGTTLLMPVVEYLTELLKGCKYQQCDETTYQVISEKEHSINYYWIHRTSERTETI